MRRVGHLHARLCDPEFMDRAISLTVRGKRRRKDVAWFLFRREDETARLVEQLSDGSWEPEGFEVIRIRDPKPRIIARTTIADRVVHTALVEAMKPVLYRSLRPECFACRPGMGTHRAVLHLQRCMRSHRFALHLDVRAYFPSIDLQILRQLLRRRIKDPRFLGVIDQVLDAGQQIYTDPELRRFARLEPGWPPPGRGLPVGTHISQVLAAHLYLDALDHWLVRTLRVPATCRYVDDIFLFSQRRSELIAWRRAVGEWLDRERGLRLKHPHARPVPCHGHLDALGHRIRRSGVVPLERTRRRLASSVAREIEGGRRGNRPDFEASVRSRVGLLLWSS
jgi:retron-type reverse transcriptase